MQLSEAEKVAALVTERDRVSAVISALPEGEVEPECADSLGAEIQTWVETNMLHDEATGYSGDLGCEALEEVCRAAGRDIIGKLRSEALRRLAQIEEEIVAFPGALTPA